VANLPNDFGIFAKLFNRVLTLFAGVGGRVRLQVIERISGVVDVWRIFVYGFEPFRELKIAQVYVVERIVRIVKRVGQGTGLACFVCLASGYKCFLYSEICGTFETSVCGTEKGGVSTSLGAFDGIVPDILADSFS
jgi:hypothetical protein